MDPPERADDAAPRDTGPLGDLPPVEHDFNRNPLEISDRVPNEPAAAKGGGGRLFLGLLIAAGGVFLLVYSNQHEPTLEHALSGKEILSDQAFTILQTGGWIAIVLGAVLALAGLLRSGR